MASPAPIVVGYDGSPDASRALDWAAQAARARQCPLRVVVVATDLDYVVGSERDDAQSTADETAKQASDRLAGLTHEVEVVRGPAVPRLLDASTGAQMLVVGSHGHSVFVGAFVGSTSQHVVHHARCPVVVVREASRADARRIVVGVDGSAESEQALRFGCALVGDNPDHALVAVYGYHAYNAAKGNLEDVTSSETGRRIEAAERHLHDWVAPVAADFPDLDIGTEAIAVPATRMLVDCSEAASMIVVGSRGRDAFAELLLGSVSQHVLHAARCPVAVVR